MSEKNWVIELDGNSKILVFLQTDNGLVVSFSVVLVTIIAGSEECVIRYDTAHGQAHQDILGKRSGLIEKAWLLDLTNNEAFEYAIQDFKDQYEYYIQFYLAN